MINPFIHLQFFDLLRYSIVVHNFSQVIISKRECLGENSSVLKIQWRYELVISQIQRKINLRFNHFVNFLIKKLFAAYNVNFWSHSPVIVFQNMARKTHVYHWFLFLIKKLMFSN